MESSDNNATPGNDLVVDTDRYWSTYLQLS